MLMYLVTITPILIFLKGTESLLEPVRKCVPTASVQGPCHVCVCSIDGIFHCRKLQCQEDKADGSSSSTKLPEIRYGMKCTYGKSYKMDCNTCRCGHRNSLLCTKAACLDTTQSEIILTEDEKDRNISKDVDIQNNNIDKKKKTRKVVRREYGKSELRTDTATLPKLPQKKKCVPGRIYEENCKRIFCKASRQPSFSSVNACDKPKVVRDLVPEDVRSRVKDREFQNLPTLAHSAAICTPGTTYKVDCNVCICDEFKNLMCDRMLCISFADMHRAEAMQKSGLPCNSDLQENDVIQSKCVECACNGTTICSPKENCVADTEVLLRSYGARRDSTRLAFDMEKMKCLPDHIYKDNCNKCYCQKDETLRCTQKTCLNYSQSLVLEKQHAYLKKHGM